MIAGEVNESRRKRELNAKNTPLIKLPNTKKKKIQLLMTNKWHCQIKIQIGYEVANTG